MKFKTKFTWESKKIIIITIPNKFTKRENPYIWNWKLSLLKKHKGENKNMLVQRSVWKHVGAKDCLETHWWEFVFETRWYPSQPRVMNNLQTPLNSYKNLIHS